MLEFDEWIAAIKPPEIRAGSSTQFYVERLYEVENVSKKVLLPCRPPSKLLFYVPSNLWVPSEWK